MKYFTLDEFDCPSLPNSGKNMDSSFLAKLEQAREIAGIPFKITSGYRTKEHNAEVGGVPNSSHLIGVASDIAVSGGADRYIICLLYTSPSPRDGLLSRMPSSA